MKSLNKFFNRYFKKNKIKTNKQEIKIDQQQYKQSQQIIIVPSDVSETERASTDSNSSASEIELLVSFELQSPDLLFKHMQNVSHYSKTEITLDHSTLEQMYMDKDLFNSQITTINTNSLMESSASSSSSSMSDSSTNSSMNLLPSEASVQRIDEVIRFELYRLKLLANSDHPQNTHNPVSISMLETLYELKIKTLNQESVDARRKLERDSTKRFFNVLSSKIKGFRQRSKSVDKNSNRNHYSIERTLIECNTENKIRSMQFEILASIKDLEMQYRTIRQQTMSNSSVKRNNYTTENAMKKRIRNRHRHHSCNSRSRCNSINDSRRSSICMDFESSVIVPERYKNNYAEETSV